MPFHIKPFLTLSLASWFLLTLLVLRSGPAYAEWVKSAYTESEGGYTVWFDPDTIRNKGDLVKIWALYDYKTIQTVAGSSYLSESAQLQYDCAEERYRFLSRIWFSGYMGSGNVVFNNSNESKWDAVAPGSVGQALWKFACGKQ